MSDPIAHPSVERGGFMIPLAIIALVIMSMMGMAGMYVARTNLAASIAVRRSVKALYAGDAGAAKTVANWESLPVGALLPGDSLDLGWQSLPDGSSYRTVIRRVDDASSGSVGLYQLRSTGRPSAQSTARRDVVTVVQASAGGSICCEGAVLIQGRFDVRGRRANDPVLPEVDGTDRTPAAWFGECLAPPVDVDGVYIRSLAQLRILRFGDLAGAPPSTQDGTISNATFTDFGGYTYAQLTSIANITFTGNRSFGNNIGPRTSVGQCDTSVNTNWGDPANPANPCWGHLPVVHVTGNLTITGSGVGQGILLVGGNLTIRGNFDYYGIVIAQGQLRHQGRGSEIQGGVMVRNRSGGTGTSRVQSGSRIQYSSCAVQRAMTGLSSVTPLPGRSWFETLD